ncbi:anti-sigma factor family protein [Streptomyces sp. NPDC008313]|uniref:anti-sigma factor family protein n=1 Tax=Streptomyces sp. NPDC008313 TaxID=3364826 RepID=UPI0036E618B7
MSGSRPTPAEQHLGDRLSALVDGELGHESRERVLAHLATCAKCKAEADAQRRLKNVFAEMAPPPPSESFLARLQGLPAGGGSDDTGPPDGRGFAGLPWSAEPSRSSGFPGVFGTRAESFAYVPSGPHADLLPPSQGRGFRIHDVSRHETERSASRGMRFAFAAAGAVSLAAIALGGVTAGGPVDTVDARGGTGTGSNVTPMRSQGSGVTTAPESQRRRSVGPLLAQGRRSQDEAPVAPTELSAPLLPGFAAPADGQDAVSRLTTPVVAGAAAMTPLIRPLTAPPPAASTAWSTVSEATTPGLLAAPIPTSSPSAAPSPLLSSRTVR